MEDLTGYDMNELKNKLDAAIDQGKVEEADRLAAQISQNRQEDLNITMPENFPDQIRFQEQRRRKNMKMKRMKIAAAAAVFLLAGSAVYAAAPLIQKTIKNIDNGMVVGEGKDNTQFGDSGSEIPDKEKAAEQLQNRSEDEMERILSEEEGSTSDLWLRKIRSIDIAPRLEWVEGQGWVEMEDEADRTITTKYVYKDLKDALTDSDYPMILPEKLAAGYELADGEAYYSEYTQKDNDNIFAKSVDGIYRNQQGARAEYHFQWDQEEVGQEFILSGDQVTGGSSYTAADGTVYTLEEGKDDGTAYISAAMAAGNYRLYMKFTGLTEAEIHAILDSIDTSEFLQ